VKRRLTAAVLLGIAGWVGASAWMLEQRIRPAPEPVGPPPADFPSLKPVSFTTSDGWTLSGWQAPAHGKTSTVILLHQYKANRWAMMERARLLHRLGYGVLLYDARACGESAGDRVSFGIHERNDLIAAVQFLQDQGIATLGALGRSQGAATVLLSSAPLDAIVLESCYDELRKSFRRRMETHLGFYLPGADLPLWWMTRHRLQLNEVPHHPAEEAAKVRAPKLIIAGSMEKRLPTTDTMNLYNQASTPKELWMVEGGAHEDFYSYMPSEYEDRVGSFFEQQLP
jgi:fermentation-respiration switch protein FrsA (DUF1100 family)